MYSRVPSALLMATWPESGSSQERNGVGKKKTQQPNCSRFVSEPQPIAAEAEDDRTAGDRVAEEEEVCPNRVAAATEGLRGEQTGVSDFGGGGRGLGHWVCMRDAPSPPTCPLLR